MDEGSEMSGLQLMIPPFVACMVLVAMLSYLGLHVIAREVIFVDLSLAQMAALGGLSALLIHVEADSTWAYAFALFATAVGALLFALTRSSPRQERRVPQEAFIGIVYVVASAAAVLVANKVPGGGEAIEKTLTGSILWVTFKPTIIKLAAAYAALGVFHYFLRHRFLTISFHPEEAERLGWKIRWWDFLFYLSFGVVITLAVPVAGVLVVFSFLVVPAGIGVLLSRGMRGVAFHSFGSCALRGPRRRRGAPPQERRAHPAPGRAGPGPQRSRPFLPATQGSTRSLLMARRATRVGRSIEPPPPRRRATPETGGHANSLRSGENDDCEHRQTFGSRRDAGSLPRHRRWFHPFRRSLPADRADPRGRHQRHGRRQRVGNALVGRRGAHSARRRHHRHRHHRCVRPLRRPQPRGRRVRRRGAIPGLPLGNAGRHGRRRTTDRQLPDGPSPDQLVRGRGEGSCAPCRRHEDRQPDLQARRLPRCSHQHDVPDPAAVDRGRRPRAHR